MFDQMTFSSFHNATGLPELQAGAAPFDSLESPTIRASGLAPVLANHSARLAQELGLLTSGTYGPRGSISSASAILQKSMESKLQVLMRSSGSTLFNLTWKQRVTPSGLQIFARRASVPRISVNGFGSWPTPNASEISNSTEIACSGDGRTTPNKLGWAAVLTGWPTPNSSNVKGAIQSMESFLSQKDAGRQQNLQDLAVLSHWPTATVSDATAGMRTAAPKRGPAPGMQAAAALASWVTPSARDWKDTPGMSTERPDGRSRLDQLPRQAGLTGWPTPRAEDSESCGAHRGAPDSMTSAARLTGPARLTASGEMLTGSTAGMESGGQLSPVMSAWLMGYPMTWCLAAPKNMPKKATK